MATGSAETNIGQTGGKGSENNIVGWRDAYTTFGAAELLNNLGAATSSATSGAVTVGDRIIGGNSKQLGIIKTIAAFAGVAILLKIYLKSR